MRITHTIVSQTGALIGFIMDRKISASIEELAERGFSNNQVDISKDKGVVCKKGIYLNKLPMLAVDNGQLKSVNNTITLKAIIEKGGKVIGGQIEAFNGVHNTDVKTLRVMSRIFEFDNFAIIVRNGTAFFRSKNESQIDTIPRLVLKEENKNMDIIDVIELIARLNGMLAYMPTEKYNSNSQTQSDESEFNQLGIAEVAYPYISVSNTKFNIGMKFRKVGYINVEGQKILCFSIREKSIIYNGNRHVDKLGVIIDASHEEELCRALGNKARKITEEYIIGPVKQVVDINSMAMYEIRLDDYEIISPDKIKSSIMSEEEIGRLSLERYDLDLAKKAVGPYSGLMKIVKQGMSNEELSIAEDKKVLDRFSSYKKEFLDQIEKAGVNIYTGEYTSRDYKSYSKGNTALTVEYIIDGYDSSKISGTKLIEMIETGEEIDCSTSVDKVVKNILKMRTNVEKYRASKEVYDKVNKSIEAIDKKLWANNMAVFIGSNRTSVLSNSDNWVLDETARDKNKEVYRNKIYTEMKAKTNLGKI